MEFFTALRFLIPPCIIYIPVKNYAPMSSGRARRCSAGAPDRRSAFNQDTSNNLPALVNLIATESPATGVAAARKALELVNTAFGIVSAG